MELKELKTGRAGREPSAQEKKRRRSFSESVLFTLGLAFIIVYFAGLMYSAGGADETYMPDSVAVMAEQKEDAADEEKGIWDILEDGLSKVFKDGTGDGK